ncbi:MAG: UbiX family flavin prenyltransferase [Actinobacteria bacterium]|nr:UbiX family flavin prenyltransferase [Actinomycetota bacterium]
MCVAYPGRGIGLKRYVIAVTGVSGAAYGLRLVEQLLEVGEVTLIFTKTGAEVTAYELGLVVPAEGAKEAVLRYLELPADLPLRVAAEDDLFDAVASGSSRFDAVVVAPASMGFIGSLASGLASGLAERTADVALKERRTLVVVPRETPLNLIHLRNLTTLAEAGAVVAPAMPAFYQRPTSVDDMVNFVVGKVLDLLAVEHELYPRWRS